MEDTAVWFTTHHWVGTPLHTQVLQHFLAEVEEMEDRQIDRWTDRQQRVLLTSDVCLQWGHTEMFKMLQERSVMEECKENLDEQRNNTGW